MWNECGDVKRERSGGEDWHVKRIRNSSLNSRLINLFSLLLLCGLRFSECWNTSFVGVVQISFRDPLCWKIKGCIENPIFNARSWSLAALHSARQGSFLNSMKAPPRGGGLLTSEIGSTHKQFVLHSVTVGSDHRNLNQVLLELRCFLNQSLLIQVRETQPLSFFISEFQMDFCLQYVPFTSAYQWHSKIVLHSFINGRQYSGESCRKFLID